MTDLLKIISTRGDGSFFLVNIISQCTSIDRMKTVRVQISGLNNPRQWHDFRDKRIILAWWYRTTQDKHLARARASVCVFFLPIRCRLIAINKIIIIIFQKNICLLFSFISDQQFIVLSVSSGRISREISCFCFPSANGTYPVDLLRISEDLKTEGNLISSSCYTYIHSSPTRD